MFQVGGIRKIKQKGGHSHGMIRLSPADVNGNLDNTLPMGTSNFAKNPNTFPSKYGMNGGAGFGYTDGSNTQNYAGSYSPITKNCTGCEVSGRGGNNFMSGGAGNKKKNYTHKQKGCKGKGSRKAKRSGKKSGSLKRKHHSKRKSKSNGKKHNIDLNLSSLARSRSKARY
jgi:hypothetical protein